MFERIKEMSKLQELQKQIKQKVVEITENGVVVQMNGGFEVLSITLNPDLDIPTQERAVTKAINMARGKIQKELVQSMAGNLF